MSPVIDQYQITYRLIYNLTMFGKITPGLGSFRAILDKLGHGAPIRPLEIEHPSLLTSTLT